MLIDLSVKKLLPTALLGLALAGCAQDGPVKGAAEAIGMATTPQESKAFVRATRPAELEYIPVGTSITRAAPRKPVADYKPIESALEAKQKANEAAGNTAKELGASTQPPKPAEIPPLN